MDVFEQLRWAVGHDPCRVGDRAPGGAVVVGERVSLVLRVDAAARELVDAVRLLVGDAADTLEIVWDEVELAACEGGYTGTLSPGRFPHVAFYVFKVFAGEDVFYYVPRVDGRATAGELVQPGEDGEWTDAGWSHAWERCGERPAGEAGLAGTLPGFQVTVYDPAFSTPEWMPGAIMYQIFPDRFCRGSAGVRPNGVDSHERMGRPVRLHEDWNEPVEWLGDVTPEDGAASAREDAAGQVEAESADAFRCAAADADGPLPGADGGETPDEVARQAQADLLNRRMGAYDPVDFYGGTLAGIREKLPYLASLGVEALYLNPVFEARSNHRYDTADYERIDPLLGDEGEFRQLADAAREQGIALVLDAVLSHTGDDSRYFNAVGSYDEPGAAQGSHSPYHSWYFWEGEGEGATYRSWWGFPSLPEVDEHDPSWQAYMFGEVSGDGTSGTGAAGREASRPGVLGAWLAAGAGGYRLDVADELPDDVLAKLRETVKGVDPNAAIIGEVWEDATTKVSYGRRRDYALGGALDSVMNYPLRDALLGFATGEVDAYQLASFLKLQQANYPAPMYHCLMNLLSSHDVERIRAVLACGGTIKHLPRNEQLARVRAISPAEDASAARMQRMIVGLLYALPGMPCVYYGDERGLLSGGDPFCRATFPWDDDAREREDCGEDLTAFYRNMGAKRKDSSVLRRGSLACTAPNPDTLCVVRALDDGKLAIAVANRAPQPQAFMLDLLAPDLPLPPQAREAATRHDHGLVPITVAPYATRFLDFAGARKG